MKSVERRMEILKKMLLAAYRKERSPEFGDRWQAVVMRRVRELGPLQSKPDPLVQFGQFVWRLAPVTCLLIIVSTAVLLNFDFTPDYNVLISAIPEAEEMTLAAQLLPL